VSDAAVHDSQKLDGLVTKTNTSADVYADSAYRSAETEAGLRARGFRSRVQIGNREARSITDQSVI
jgi:IS5 family transposase